MAGALGTQRVIFIILRFMRGPLFLLITVYATSMLGWALIPGPEGKPEPMGFFHAFYFLTYTATTTGFGEIPHPFSEAQRMWAIVSLYAGVIAWLYALGAIIHLLQNPHFRAAQAERGFTKEVRRLSEPFVVVCGFGNRGSLLTRGLSDAGIAAVIVDGDPDRINAVRLRDYRVPTPALAADARDPERLVEAGVTRDECRAVVALTSNEAANAKIAVSVRLLNPNVRVVTELTQSIYEETLTSLGSGIHIIDPFQAFARYLVATIQNPAVHMLYEWLVGAPGANLAMYSDISKGAWIICGYGRMGRAIRESLEAFGVPTVVIDPVMPPEEAALEGHIAERAGQRALLRAGIDTAAGIVAGTGTDHDNLSIALNARALNPDVYVIVRQNQHRNERLFEAARANLVMQPTLVSARRVLFLLIAPLLRRFLDQIRECQVQARHEFLMDVIAQLNQHVGGAVRPRLWTVAIGPATAPALLHAIEEGLVVTLGDVLRDPADRQARLPCVPLVMQSGDAVIVMPDLTRPLASGDEILLCGREHALHLLESTLASDYTLRYLMTGYHEPRSHVFRWLTRRFPALERASTG